MASRLVLTQVRRQGDTLHQPALTLVETLWSCMVF